MANIANRSPWVVTQPGKEAQKFRLKSQAKTFLDELNNPRAKMKQLETAFEVQIKLKDKDGNTVTRSATHSSLAEAEKWAVDEEKAIIDFREKNGSFDQSYETMTVEEALLKCWEEHYQKMASSDEVKTRIPQLVSYLGKNTLLRSLNLKKMLDLRNSLKKDDYSASSIRNFFAVVSTTLKWARSEWLYPIDNVARGIKLEKPNNAKQRNWVGDEKDRLFKSIEKRSPWLLPIVELSLEMSFRRGELVMPAKGKRAKGATNGLMWEGVNFDRGTLQLFQEKNDWKKGATEEKGRIVPMTERMREILLELYQKSPTKKGYVFSATTNSVTHAFTDCCKAAEPAIENLTFHSCRKIATYGLSKKVSNPILLGKLTGHRDIKTLADRYYKAPIEDLQAMLAEADATTLDGKAIQILKKELGFEDTLRFLVMVKETEDLNTLLIGKSQPTNKEESEETNP